MTTCQDLINECRYRLEPVARDLILILSSDYTANGTSLSFNDTSIGSAITQALIPGVFLTIDLEVFLVTGLADGGSISVIPGWSGSISANHAAGAVIRVNPRYSDFGIMTAMNHDLDDLSNSGLYNLSTMTLTYNPVYSAYDLTDINTSAAITGYMEAVSVRFKTPLPNRVELPIPNTMFEVIPAVGDTVTFPSGYSLVLHKRAWAGQPFYFTYKQHFVHFSAYSDDAQTHALLGPTMNDLPPIGAAISLVAPLEVDRNRMDAQPDPRRAGEVPPQAIAASTKALIALREARINAEKAGLTRQINQYRRRR